MRRDSPSTQSARSKNLLRNLYSFKSVVYAISAFFFLFFILPGLTLIWRAYKINNSFSFTALESIWTSLSLSLTTTGVSVIIIFLLGTPLAYNLARMKTASNRFLTAFIELPIVMPPVVAGLALLSTFGRQGLLGTYLDFFGLQITFTPIAVVIAQIFVGAPFYIRSAQNRFSAIPRELEESARIDGASGWCVFRTIIIPLSSRAIISGLILSWARALGEFGATILFAGNLAGKTQTMPLFIYNSLESDLGATFTSASLMLVLSLALFGLTRFLTNFDEEEVLATGY